MLRALILLIAGWLTLGAAAQDLACPALQQAALAAAAEACAEQAADSLCYGHPTVSAVLRADAPPMPHFAAGDSALMPPVDWFSTSSEAGSWGVARARLSAYPAQSLAAQPFTLLAFGDAALFAPPQVDLPPILLALEVAAARGANLRQAPSLDAPVLQTLPHQTPLRAIGRSADGGWLQVYSDPLAGGWLSAGLVTGDFSELPLDSAAAGDVPLWLPWQRFDLRSGWDDSPCADAPPSGILLQSNKSNAPLYFEINGLRLDLSGTAFLQAQVRSAMRIYLLDGSAEAAAGAVRLSGGQMTEVALAMDAAGAVAPAEAPLPAQPYRYHDLRKLPIDLLPLPSRIELDSAALVSPRPPDGGSPIAGMALDADCRLTTGQLGANIRSQPDPSAPVIAVLGYRESAEPLARAVGADGLPWWQLAPSVWIRVDATVTGGDCSTAAVPFIQNRQSEN